jgi:release factor glutamine methyltransferase
VRDHEPLQALAAADEGFSDLEAIARASAGFLLPGGMLALETGIGHHARLTFVLGESGYVRTESVADLAGRDRIVLSWRPS